MSDDFMGLAVDNLLCIVSNVGQASLLISLEYKDFTKLKVGLFVPSELGGEMPSVSFGAAPCVSSQWHWHPDNAKGGSTWLCKTLTQLLWLPPEYHCCLNGLCEPCWGGGTCFQAHFFPYSRVLVGARGPHFRVVCSKGLISLALSFADTAR